MSVPTRKQVAKNFKLREMWKEMNKKVETTKEKLTEEEHNKRVELLKQIGFLKEEKDE